MWITNRLSIAAGFIVMFQICDACRTGYTRFEDSCYHVSHDQENWIDAMTLCRTIGGHLAEIDSANENSFLKSMIASHANIASAWVGANDMDIEGRWIWWNTDRALTYTHWYPGEPNNSGNQEDCLLLGRDGTWNDGICTAFREYICELPFNGGEVVG